MGGEKKIEQKRLLTHLILKAQLIKGKINSLDLPVTETFLGLRTSLRG